jgi:hypothetical protein
MVVKSVRLPEDLHDRYIAALKADDPEANLGRGIRRHMREAVKEAEAASPPRLATS